MARIFTDGAEMGDLLFWTSYSGYLQVLGTARTGSYSYGTLSGGFSAYKSFSAVSELYGRVAFRWAQSRSDSFSIMGFRSGGTLLCKFYLDSLWHPVAYVGSSVVADSGIVADPSTWHLFEVHVKIDDSPNGIFQLKMNGIQIIDYSGDTKPGAETTVDNIYIDYNYDSYFDDLALNDTSGTSDNLWCGDGRIYKITPSGSSATTNNWVNSGGVSASANYLYVDEYPYDSDTTYVYCSGSNTGYQDQYAMTNLGLSGTMEIHRIWTEVRAKKTNSDDTYIKLGVLPSGGTDSVSGSIPLTTNYTAITGSFLKLNPFTSASWTNTDLDGLEAVIEMG